MIVLTMTSVIEGCWAVAHKGYVEGSTFDETLDRAE